MARPVRSHRLRSFVCGVDFSRHSRAALRCAAALASAVGARLTVLFVDDPLLVAAEARHGRNGRAGGARRTRAALARFVAASLKAAAGVRCANIAGEPGPGLVRFARGHRADLIVVGTRGTGGARALLFGSTTNYLVRHVRIPILVVPAPRRTGR